MTRGRSQRGVLTLQSLTSGQKLVLILSVVALLLGFWFSGHRGSSESSASGAVESIAVYESAHAERIPLVVHVVGEVHNPGVYRLPAESRVRDAIIAAGGFTPEARADSVNLAAYCEDGEQISVEAREPVPESNVIAPSLTPAPTSPPPPAGPAPRPSPAPVAARPTGRPHSAAPSDQSEPREVGSGNAESSVTSDLPEFARQPRRQQVRLNHAGLEELQEIPGVGPELARRIIYHRHINGPFRGVGDLQQVSGIGPQTADTIMRSVTLD